MLDFLKKKGDFPPLTEERLARIRKVATSPAPMSGEIALKRDIEEWIYSRYMYNHLKPYYKRIDEERARKREEKELARLKAIKIAEAELQRQENERRASIEAKRREEIRETFEEMEEIVKEIRDTD